MPFPKGLRQKIVLLLFGLALLLAAIAWGVSYQIRLAEQRIADMAELKDPSPFRAVLLGHLNRINVNLLAYVQSRDRAPLEQIVSSEKDFETSVEEFQKENPRLFPPLSHARILEAYEPFKEAVKKILQASTHQAQRWESLLANDDRMMSLMERSLRPLAQKDPRRIDMVSSLENQLREVPKDLTQYLLNHTGSSSEQVEQNERKFDVTLNAYGSAATTVNERALLKLIGRLWIENVAHAQEILDLEKTRTEAFLQILQDHQDLQQTLAGVLPAVRPEVIEAQKTSMFHAIVLMIILTALLLLAGAGSTLASLFWIYKRVKYSAVSAPVTIGMSLDGKINGWSPAAQRFYGYTAAEIHGSSVAKLFASENEIAHLYQKMKETKEARFDALHVTKKGKRFNVHLTFAEEAGGILLSIYPLAPS